MRSYIFLVIGLLVGGIGGVLFIQSMPEEEGTLEEKIAKMEIELKRSENRIIALQGMDERNQNLPGNTLADRTRRIAEDIREGRPVTPDDIFHAVQPLLRDLSPLFDRIRVRDQEKLFDTMIGELSRKYDLDTDQQKILKDWFTQRAEDNAETWTSAINEEGVSFVDLVKASRDFHPKDGLDEMMEGFLSGDKLDDYREDRFNEKIKSVQKEADRKMHRLDEIVDLSEDQKDQVFEILATRAKDFNSEMQFEGLNTSTDSKLAKMDTQHAIDSVLTDDQRRAYKKERRDRRRSERDDLRAIGLTIPPEWDMLDGSDF